MKRFLDSNIFYGILAMVLAIFLLFYVDSSENPVSEKTYNNVNVAVSSLPEGMLLEKEPGPVEIRVNGYRSAINTAFARDVKASVDLRGAEPGTATYKVQYSLPSGLNLVYIKPEYIELTVDELGTKNLPVVCRTSNTVAEGYGSLEPVVNPASIVVTGPQRVLDQVEAAQVSLDLTGRNSDFQGSLPVVLFDKEWQEIQDSRLNLSAKEVSVHVVVTENLSSKSVSVRTALSGTIDEKYVVTGVEVQPSTVKITGSYAVISKIDSLTTEPIDLATLTESFHGSVKLLVPSNVEVLDGNEVEITIRIEENLTRRTFEGIPVEVRNGPAGMSYGTIPPTVDVTLAAYPQVFANASSGGEYRIDIRAYVDLAGQPADTRDYNVMLEYPAEYQVVEVSPQIIRLYSN